MIPQSDMALDHQRGRNGDGVSDVEDAFPDARFESVDTDMDGVGDNPDAYSMDATEPVNTNNDGVSDNSDAFPRDRLETVDSDGDGVGANRHEYPADETEYIDSDEDAIGDTTEEDDDHNGLSDEEKLTLGVDCKLSNPLLADSDGGGILKPEVRGLSLSSPRSWCAIEMNSGSMCSWVIAMALSLSLLSCANPSNTRV